MFKSLQTIRIISDYLKEKGVIARQICSINDIYDFFTHLQNHKNKFYTLYIYNYLFNFISNDNVAKKKVSAELFENFLANTFDGQVCDDKKRKNSDISFSGVQISDYFLNVKDIIASNRREKADIRFDNNYSFSVKTLCDDTIEINMGSFDKNVLFDNLGVEKNQLGERKSSNGVGAGSKAQFGKLLTYVESVQKTYEKFSEKFNKMVEFIYSDDLLLAIKNNYKMQLYFFSGNEIVQIFQNHSKNKDDFLKIINRYEGNSLRIDRTPLIQNCTKHISLDFSYLKSSVIELINDFDLKLHKGYFEYFSDKNSKAFVFDELEKIFSKFDENFEDLA